MPTRSRLVKPVYRSHHHPHHQPGAPAPPARRPGRASTTTTSHPHPGARPGQVPRPAPHSEGVVPSPANSVCGSGEHPRRSRSKAASRKLWLNRGNTPGEPESIRLALAEPYRTRPDVGGWASVRRALSPEAAGSHVVEPVDELHAVRADGFVGFDVAWHGVGAADGSAFPVEEVSELSHGRLSTPRSASAARTRRTMRL